MASTDTPARDAVLVKYLNEAYGKEKQLEQNLTVLIARATNHKTLKKGLQDHLKVTKSQSRGLQQRIRALGGKAAIAPDLPGPPAATSAASAVANVANRALATAKGPVQLLRGTGEADNMLRSVRDAFWNEAEEIAHYDVIHAVAEKLKDTETAKLAKQFRRDEERMQAFLGRQIKTLVGEVVKDEVPASERRNSGSTRRRRSTSRSASSSRSASARGRSSSSNGSASTGRTSTARTRAAQKAAATRTRKAAGGSAKRTAGSARRTAKSAGTTARKAGSAARSTAKRAAK